MNEEDFANKILNEIKEQGYKSFEDRERHRQIKQALQDYDRYLTRGE